MNAALDKTLCLIDVSFRKERLQRKDTIAKACNLREMVMASRCTFQQGIERLQLDVDEAFAAFEWIAADDAKIEADYGHKALVNTYQTETLAWLRRLMGRTA